MKMSKQIKIMKLLITTLLIVFLIGCNSKPKYEYVMIYRVHYSSSYYKDYKVIGDKFYIGSDEGSNYIKHGSITGSTIIDTSAPIEVIKLTKIQIYP